MLALVVILMGENWYQSLSGIKGLTVDSGFYFKRANSSRCEPLVTSEWYREKCRLSIKADLLCFYFQNTMLFSLLKTARLLRLFRAARKLDRNYEYMTSLLFLMIMFFMLVAHWLACIWYAIGQQEAVTYDGLSWLSVLGYQLEKPIEDGDPTSGPSLRSRYLTSLYYVMTLCTTVGFGNVAANTDGERIFSICCMLMGGKSVRILNWYGIGPLLDVHRNLRWV